MMSTNYLTSVIKQFEYYKLLGEKAMAQLPDEAFFWQYNEESNSIAMILQHISGNMLSRFTDFLTSDGEKTWRNRDEEFEPKILTKDELMDKWDRGWKCLLAAIDDLTAAQLEDIVYIRNEGHTVLEAINRQLAHYPYHIGQIVFIAKMVANENWESLSIPRNKSADYNLEKFSQEKSKRHFTDI
ncbi:DUF1572 family protein [Pedobacter insulae]|uniref:DinB superfamily protein n=1 Tax=Pedobacter insulae TaxID=414048 RepID=A0A1I2YJG5_9SPHI|nr:DUF1572 family protein [Pedobacter insulae]SFH25667.1 Protein of unknown function [Pedobacter insulae]